MCLPGTTARFLSSFLKQGEADYPLASTFCNTGRLPSGFLLFFLSSFHLSAGKALSGAGSAADTPKGVSSSTIPALCRGMFACSLGSDAQTH